MLLISRLNLFLENGAKKEQPKSSRLRSNACHVLPRGAANLPFALLVAQTKGDNLAGTIKSIWVHVNATKVLTDFEAAALPGKDASVQTFRIKELELKTKYDKSLGLGDDRKKEFKQELEKKVQTALYEVIYNEYKRVLERAVADTYFTRA